MLLELEKNSYIGYQNEEYWLTRGKSARKTIGNEESELLIRNHA